MTAGIYARLSRILCAGSVLAATATLATEAGAVLIWQDEFARSSSSSVGNGWVETEDDSNDVGIVFNHYLLLRDNGPDGTARQFGISTQGYEDITVEFRWRPWESEDDDTIRFSFQTLPEQSWLLAFEEYLGGPETYRTTTVALPSVADDASLLDIGFTIDASYKYDALKIDYVRIYGTEITGGGGTSDIPEPAAITIFGLGLAGLGLAARRRRQR